MKRTRKPRRVSTLALVAGLWSAALLPYPTSAQEPPPDAGAQSKQGEAQPGQPISAPATGVPMPGDEPVRMQGTPAAPVLAPVAGKILTMDEALRAASAAMSATAPAAEQPSFAAAKALRPSGGGGQKGRLAAEAVAGSHLQLVLHVSASGEIDLASAAEVPGPAPLNDEPLGNFAYVVKDGESTLAVQGVPDPFELRAFSPPGTQRGHHFERAKNATVVVQVPLPRSDARIERLGVSLVELSPDQALSKIDASELARLERTSRIRVLATLPAATLAPQIRQRALPLERVIEPPR